MMACCMYVTGRTKAIMGLPALRTQTRFLRTPLLLGLLMGLSVFVAVQVTERSGLEATPVLTGDVTAASVTSPTLGGAQFTIRLPVRILEHDEQQS